MPTTEAGAHTHRAPRLVDFHSHYFAVEFLGAEHVLLGSDWPIMPIVASPRTEQALASAGLSRHEQDVVLGENAARLLARPSASPR